jgi:hypothetical protein
MTALYLGLDGGAGPPHAGIPKRDELGRSLDVPALRTTFGTLLSKGELSLRTAQAAMRYADPSLNANVNTDPRLLDVSGALGALPTLPLDSEPQPRRGACPNDRDRSYRPALRCTDSRLRDEIQGNP